MKKFTRRLNVFNVDDRTIEQQVDWLIVRVELNGFDFKHHIVNLWVGDPAFYQSIRIYKSDVPAHESPAHHAVTKLFWTCSFPLSAEEEVQPGENFHYEALPGDRGPPMDFRKPSGYLNRP